MIQIDKTTIGLVLPFILISLFHCAKKENPKQNDLALRPFVKIDSVNPMLNPGANSFTCPINGLVRPWWVK